MPNLFKGKAVAIRPLFSDYSNITSSPAANTGSLDVQLWIYKHAFCREDGEKATSHRKELLTKLAAKPKVVVSIASGERCEIVAEKRSKHSVPRPTQGS
jgi:hypothetical protein